MTRTVFVTGASGFIAKHIILKLLARGDRVIGSLRSPGREGEVRAAVAEAGADDRLSFVTLDLTEDAGWDAALAGADALIHTASPFPLAAPENEDDLIRPAVDGTLRTLKAAKVAGVARVVLTSSVAAVSSGPPLEGRAFDERDWSDVNSPLTGAYAKSKTLAERAAWDFAAEHGLALTAINPSMVMGRPLDVHFGSSIDLVKRLMRGRDPMMPQLGFSVVDVEDVAEAHVRVLDTPDAVGERIIVTAGPMWFVEMTRALKAEFPNRRFATRVAPTVLLRIIALFDKSVRGILPSLGRNDAVSNAKARALLGLDFAPPAEALLKSAHFLVDHKLV